MTTNATIDLKSIVARIKMMKKPLQPDEAKARIREILSRGRVVYSKPHAMERLQQRDLTMLDCANVLHEGSVDPPYRENGKWRYKVKTAKIEVVIQFLKYDRLMIVTAWRKGGKR